MPTVRTLTPEQRRAATEPARIGARFFYAESRVRKIADTDPPLTRAQLLELAQILLSAAGDGDE